MFGFNIRNFNHKYYSFITSESYMLSYFISIETYISKQNVSKVEMIVAHLGSQLHAFEYNRVQSYGKCFHSTSADNSGRIRLHARLNGTRQIRNINQSRRCVDFRNDGP
jgi:hypothetical protein